MLRDRSTHSGKSKSSRRQWPAVRTNLLKFYARQPTSSTCRPQTRCGFNNVTVITDVVDPLIADYAERWGYKYLTTEQVEKNNIKFDVVIGNPPYQNDAAINPRQRAIWPKFIELAVSLVKENGVIALITSKTWATNPLYQRVFLPRKGALRSLHC
jgi:hypothetical protein